MEEKLKVNEDVLKQLVLREQALKSANTLFQMAQREYESFVKIQFKILGLDENKNYNLDLKTGCIFEVKKEPVSKQKEEEIKEE